MNLCEITPTDGGSVCLREFSSVSFFLTNDSFFVDNLVVR